MQIDLLETSFEKIVPQAGKFSASFYNTLFHHNPELKRLFVNTNKQAMEKKLIFSLAAIVENLRNPEVLGPALKSLGARHFEVGTIESHYPLVGQALLETFSAYLGETWTADLAEAWTTAYGAIATTMIAGAQQPQDHLQEELTFYDWVDLYGEASPRVKNAIANLTNYHYGNRPEDDVVKQV